MRRLASLCRRSGAVRTTIKCLTPLVFVLAVNNLAVAQAGTGFTIQHMVGTHFTQFDSPVTQSIPSANFVTWSPDYLGSNWWFYRVDGIDTREESFKNATGTTASGNVATTTWSFSSFNASLRYELTWLEFITARLDMDLTVTNTSGVAIGLNLFNLVNPRPAGGANARGSYEGNGHIRAETQFEGWGMAHRAANPTAYQGGGLTAMNQLMLDTNVNNLSNSGLPFDPAPFASIYQFTVPLGPGESAVVRTSVYVPEPSTLIVVCLGLLAVTCFRRRVVKPDTTT